MADTTQSEPHVLAVLKYLGLPKDYTPSPVEQPEEFLAQHMRSLPRDLLALFSPSINAKQRTKLPAIRNRRLRYFDSSPPEFRLPGAKATFSSLWPGPVGNMQDVARGEAKDEKEWADKEFMEGRTEGRQVGKLGELLGTWTEEREAERARDDEEAAEAAAQEELSPREAEELFKRRLKERFIYGSLRFCRASSTTTALIGTKNGTRISIGTRKSGGSTTRKRALRRI